VAVSRHSESRRVGRLDGKRSVEAGERRTRALGGERMFERIGAQQKTIGVEPPCLLGF
jgi:hypothetical protein